EKHRIGAPKLLAFGQRFRAGRCEAFLLYQSVPDDAVPFKIALGQLDREQRAVLLDGFADLLQKLHEAGCEAVSADRIAVTGRSELFVDPSALVFRKHVSESRRKSDLQSCLRSIKTICEPDELERFVRAAVGQR